MRAVSILICGTVAKPISAGVTAMWMEYIKARSENGWQKERFLKADTGLTGSFSVSEEPARNVLYIILLETNEKKGDCNV